MSDLDSISSKFIDCNQSESIIPKRSLEIEEGLHSAELQDLERRNEALEIDLKKSKLKVLKARCKFELNKLERKNYKKRRIRVVLLRLKNKFCE